MKHFLWCLAVVLVVAALPARAADAPAPVFLAYHKVAIAATDLSELYPYLASASLKKMQSLTPEQRTQVLAMMQQMSVSEPHLVKTVLNGDKAFVYVEGIGPNPFTHKEEMNYGKVDMVRESGAWKVLKEHWASEYKQTK